jgi:hypothetical protein
MMDLEGHGEEIAQLYFEHYCDINMNFRIATSHLMSICIHPTVERQIILIILTYLM